MQPPDATGVAPSPGDRRSSISSSKVPEGSLASRDAKPLKLDNASEQELSSQVQGDASINEQLQACAKEIDAIAAPPSPKKSVPATKQIRVPSDIAEWLKYPETIMHLRILMESYPRRNQSYENCKSRD